MVRLGVGYRDLEHSIMWSPMELQVGCGEAGWVGLRWGGGKSSTGKSFRATQFTNPTSCLFVCLKVRV